MPDLRHETFRNALARARRRGVQLRLNLDVTDAFLLLCGLQPAMKSTRSRALLQAGLRDLAWEIRRQIAPAGSELEPFVESVWEGDGRF